MEGHGPWIARRPDELLPVPLPGFHLQRRRYDRASPPGGPDSGGANAINDWGDVVGSAEGGPAGYGYRAFSYSDGSTYDLGTLGESDSSAIGINNARTIVGTSKLRGDVTQHAFVYTDQSGMVDLSGRHLQAGGARQAGNRHPVRRIPRRDSPTATAQLRRGA